MPTFALLDEEYVELLMALMGIGGLCDNKRGKRSLWLSDKCPYEDLIVSPIIRDH